MGDVASDVLSDGVVDMGPSDEGRPGDNLLFAKRFAPLQKGSFAIFSLYRENIPVNMCEFHKFLSNVS